jgi:hypothetical protein
MLVDLPFLTLGAVAIANSGTGKDATLAKGLGAVASVGYLLGPALVHAVHGRATESAESFGLRLGLPVGGALLGLAIATIGGGGYQGLGYAFGAVAGGASGLIAALVLDYASLATEEVAAPAQASLVPQVSVFPIRRLGRTDLATHLIWKF